MFQYTFQNHFKFGYNHLNKYQYRTSENDVFSFEYGKVLNTDLTWRQSNELAARQIYSNKFGDLYVLLSGGMDSEICLRSFIDQSLPVKTISLRFLDLDQTEELAYVYKAIKKYNIVNHIFVDIDVKSFVLSKEFNYIADSIKCVSPIIILHLWLANQVPGTPVIAQGEVHLRKSLPNDYVPGISPYESSEWYISESERLCSIFMNFIKREKPAIPGFFQYNVEQIYSYLTKNKLLGDLINNKVVGKLGTRSSKNLIARQFYPDVEDRVKKHGWESAQDYHDTLRAEMAQRYPYSDQNAKLMISDLLEMISK